MKMKQRLIGLAVGLGVSLGAASGSFALSLSEFNHMSEVEKDRMMFTVLHFYYYRLANDPSTEGKANCMLDLNRSGPRENQTQLVSLILDDLDESRGARGEIHTLEGLVEAVIDRECRMR